MIGTSRESFRALRNLLDGMRNDPGLPAMSGELAAASDLIGSDLGLRSFLADSGQPDAVRVGTVETLFGDRLGPSCVAVLVAAVRSRWSSPSDLVVALDGLSAQAGFLAAELAGTLPAVESELFGFSQVVAGSSDLQMRFTDPSLSPEGKAGLVHELLDGRADPITVAVLAHTLSHLRGARVDAAVSELIDLAAEQVGRSVAVVRVARELDGEQHTRLVAALTKLHGRPVRLNVDVDPAVIGGAEVRVGDSVLDGTVASRLEQARRLVAR
jgi:F-type H+-transporting ATPase subunit delta